MVNNNEQKSFLVSIISIIRFEQIFKYKRRRRRCNIFITLLITVINAKQQLSVNQFMHSVTNESAPPAPPSLSHTHAMKMGGWRAEDDVDFAWDALFAYVFDGDSCERARESFCWLHHIQFNFHFISFVHSFIHSSVAVVVVVIHSHRHRQCIRPFVLSSRQWLWPGCDHS